MAGGLAERSGIILNSLDWLYIDKLFGMEISCYGLVIY